MSTYPAYRKSSPGSGEVKSRKLRPRGAQHFPKTMFVGRKTPEKRNDVDDVSSSSSDGSDLSTESDDSYDSERERELEREWEEGMEQLKLITTIVLLPFFGKWLGKKWAYWCECWPTQRRAELPGVIY